MIGFMATAESDYDAVARLLREYVEWCRDSYTDVAWFMSKSHQLSLTGISCRLGCECLQLKDCHQ